MKKIVLVSLSNAMGMQLYCSQLANILAKKHDVSIIVTKYFDSSNINANVKIYKFFSTKRPTIDKGLLYINSYLNALKVINSCDVVHFLNSHPSNIILLNRGKCANSVFTLHDPTPHSNDLLGKCRSIIDKIISKQTNKIIIHSKMHLNNDLVKKYINKTYVTPLASKSKSKKYNPIVNNNVFLFFGRIEDYKGIDIFIEAIEMLSKDNYKFKAVIAGAGDFTKYKRKIFHENNYVINNYVIPEKEVSQLFINSTFCIMPYKTASQSGVIPLSYYYSRPVIVTNIESLTENIVLNKTGFVIDNAYSLYCLLKKILVGEYNLDKLSQNAFEYGNKFLSMEKMAKNLIKFYEI